MNSDQTKNPTPCPFCDSKEGPTVMVCALSTYRVTCEMCTGSGPESVSREGAILMWNQRLEAGALRTSADAMMEEIRELRRVGREILEHRRMEGADYCPPSEPENGCPEHLRGLEPGRCFDPCWREYSAVFYKGE
jgi:hypothetical protein